jgi:hypothetical protein
MKLENIFKTNKEKTGLINLDYKQKLIPAIASAYIIILVNVNLIYSTLRNISGKFNS